MDASSTGSRRSESGQGGDEVGSGFGLEGGQEPGRKKRKSELQAAGMHEAFCGNTMGTVRLQPYRTQQRFSRKGVCVCVIVGRPWCPVRRMDLFRGQPVMGHFS